MGTPETRQELAALGGRTRGANARRESEERLALWRATTPKVLQEALWASTHGGCNDQQKRLLTNWVNATVYEAPEEFIQDLAALLHRRRK